MKVTELFARFATQLAQQALPDDVVHHAQRAVIDWHASLYPGLDMPAVRVLEAALAEDLNRGPARLALGRAATTRAAALLNGTAAHAAEVDDSFRDAMVHPGSATIAAALAVAQANGSHGADFLRAVVVGYEVSTRIGVVMGRPHYRHWHNTGTMGCFGAAAAVASLLRLDEVAFAHALALAGTFTAGLQQAFRTEAMAKPLHAGRAAEAGVLAAQLAAKGMRSSLDVLEGASGLGQAMSDGPDWSQVDATLGDEFHITRLTFKNHIGCGHTFAAIDGALALQAQHGFRHNRHRVRPPRGLPGHAGHRPARRAADGRPGPLQPALHGGQRAGPWQRAPVGVRAGPLERPGHAGAHAAHPQIARPRGGTPASRPAAPRGWRSPCAMDAACRTCSPTARATPNSPCPMPTWRASCWSWPGRSSVTPPPARCWPTSGP